MIIGVIGATSNIASKAYLPVYASLQAQERFILYSRDWERAEKVRKQYKFEYATTDLSALETVDLVIIHAATSKHFELARRYLLAGVHVFMDKPISENWLEVQELYRLAEVQNVLFVIGFNRRFAPLTQKLKAVEHKNFVKVTKNLAHHVGDVRFLLYDIFSHPLDTLIYLLDDEPVRFDYKIKKDAAGNLILVTVFLETETALGIANMNLDSGAFTETFEIEAPSGTYRLSELTELEIFDGLDKQSIGINGWQSATYNRGFDNLIKSVIAAVGQFDGKNRSKLLENLKQKNVLKTHEIIAEILSDKK